VRPHLLDRHARTRGGIDGEIDAARGRKGDRGLDAVAAFLQSRGVLRIIVHRVLPERIADTVGKLEERIADIVHRTSVFRLHHGNQVPLDGQSFRGAEAAVPVVKDLAVAETAIRKNVGAFKSDRRRPELPQEYSAFGFIARIDGDEFAGPTAGPPLGIAET